MRGRHYSHPSPGNNRVERNSNSMASSMKNNSTNSVPETLSFADAHCAESNSKIPSASTNMSAGSRSSTSSNQALNEPVFTTARCSNEEPPVCSLYRASKQIDLTRLNNNTAESKYKSLRENNYKSSQPGTLSFRNARSEQPKSTIPLIRSVSTSISAKLRSLSRFRLKLRAPKSPIAGCSNEKPPISCQRRALNQGDDNTRLNNNRTESKLKSLFKRNNCKSSPLGTSPFHDDHSAAPKSSIPLTRPASTNVLARLISSIRCSRTLNEPSSPKAECSNEEPSISRRSRSPNRRDVYATSEDGNSQTQNHNRFTATGIQERDAGDGSSSEDDSSRSRSSSRESCSSPTQRRNQANTESSDEIDEEYWEDFSETFLYEVLRAYMDQPKVVADFMRYSSLIVTEQFNVKEYVNKVTNLFIKDHPELLDPFNRMLENARVKVQPNQQVMVYNMPSTILEASESFEPMTLNHHTPIGSLL